MLVLLNQFDMIHSGDIYCDINRSLPTDETFYILDTDDMEVESILYQDLHRYIKNEVIKIENVLLESETDRLYCDESVYTFMDFLYDDFQTTDGNFMFCPDKKTKCNGMIFVNGKDFELRVGNCYKSGKKYKNSIMLNNRYLCTIVTNDGLYFRREFYTRPQDSNCISDGFYGIPYVAKLGNIYLIHFYMYDLGTGYELLLAVDKSGDIVDVFPLNGFEKYFCDFKFTPKSEIFRTKYKAVFKEKY